MTQLFDLWLPLQLTREVGYPVKTVVDSLATSENFEGSLQQLLLLKLCQTYKDKGNTRVLESVGDMLANHLFNLDYPAQVMQELIPYISGIYGNCLKIADQGRKQSLMTKFFTMAAIQTEMNAYLNLDHEYEQLEEAEKYAGAAIDCLYECALLPKPQNASSKEIASWMIQVFPSLKNGGEFIAQRDYFLALFLYECMKKTIFNQWEFLMNIKDAKVQANSIYLQTSKCLERCAKFWKAAEIPKGQLAVMEKMSFLNVLELQNIQLGRRFAREALVLGDNLIFELQMEAASPKAIIDLRQRLYYLSRLTADQREIEHRLDLFCEHLRRDADKYYERQEWNKAADFYSNLGYKYFIAAEYVGSRVLYNLSIYFFEKAEYCRSKEPYIFQENSGNIDVKLYRRLEANGFIYGASARLSKESAIIDLFNDAADQLTEAAHLIFQDPQLHDFYNSTAHFFLAQEELAQAAAANDSRDFCRHISAGDQALGQCFPLCKNIFTAYQLILKSLIDPENQERYGDQVGYLARSGHPAPQHVVDVAHRIVSSYETGHSNHLSNDLLELGRCFIYLNPLG